MSISYSPVPSMESQDDFDLQVSQMSKSEIKAFKDFEQVYLIQHPAPVKQNPHLGWEFYTAMATSCAAVILAAFRTGQAFYISAVAKGDLIFSSLEALSAVFAIEGSVVLFALQRARRLNKTDDSSSELGLWVAFGISALAGLFQSVNLIPNPDPFISGLLSIALVISMGLGATVIAWLGGDILGVNLVRLEFTRREVNEQFAKSVHGYHANLLKAWMNSDERTAVHERKVNRYREPVHLNRSSEPVQRTLVHEPRSSEQFMNSSSELYPPITKEEIFGIFDLVLSETGQIAGVNDTARKVASKRNADGSDLGWENLKGRISGLRKQWMIEKNIGGANAAG